MYDLLRQVVVGELKTIASKALCQIHWFPPVYSSLTRRLTGRSPSSLWAAERRPGDSNSNSVLVDVPQSLRPGQKYLCRSWQWSEAPSDSNLANRALCYPRQQSLTC